MFSHLGSTFTGVGGNRRLGRTWEGLGRDLERTWASLVSLNNAMSVMNGLL